MLDQLVKKITEANKNYRNGKPNLTDLEYDELISELQKIDPNHKLLNSVEEEGFDRPTIKHSKPMLSIEKAYNIDELKRFFSRVEKITGKIDYRITAKLDGMAAKFEYGKLATRGDGNTGYDITDAIDKGMYVPNPLLRSIGEIVLLQDYFDNNLTDYFDHPRNCVVGAIKCEKLSEIQQKVLAENAIHFVDYNDLYCIVADKDYILNNLDQIITEISNTDYPIDGYVIEAIIDDETKDKIGSTNHHHKWQIAFKIQGEKKRTFVEDITWQTGKGGNITPVLEITPVIVSGAKIKRVTAHNYGNLVKNDIGIGTEIEIVRSGEVIPKIVGIISNKKQTEYVYNCPVCGTKTILLNDIIKCPNFQCSAQIKGRLQHFFKTLKIDGFGGKTIELLINNGYDSIQKIYSLTEKDVDAQSLGFGEKQLKNLISSLLFSITTNEYEAWQLLSAISIPLLGRGDSKKLLEKYSLKLLTNILPHDIINIKSFGEIKANSIVNGIEQNETIIEFIINNFNIMEKKENCSNELNGKSFVFTGKMKLHRNEMMKICEDKGGVPQKSINKSTTYLVTGEKTGKSKLDKANKYGIMIITEDDFMKMINE